MPLGHNLQPLPWWLLGSVLLKKYKCFYFDNFDKSNNINILITKYQYMYIKLTMYVHSYFFSKVQICPGLGKAKGFCAQLKLISARFEFDSVNYCNFCSFWVSFIYRCWFAGSGRLFDFIFAHLLFNGVLYFSLKNLFCEKVFF